jgi:hypothetical protein
VQGNAATALHSQEFVVCKPQPSADHAPPDAALQDGPWRVGEGIMLLVTPSHCYIARLKPAGSELLLLYSIPQPSPAQLQAGAGGGAMEVPLPVAAWLPHYRKQAAATKSHGDFLVPVAQLALAWGPRLVLFDVPLIGDQLNTSEAGEAHLRRHFMYAALVCSTNGSRAPKTCLWWLCTPRCACFAGCHPFRACCLG